MRKPTILNYIYYHCTKKKNRKCFQKSIRVEELERQFNERLNRLKIGDNYLKLALDYLQEKQELATRDEKTIRQSLQQTYDDCQTRINNLNKEYTSPQNMNHELYAPEEFKQLKDGLLRERGRIDDEMNTVKEKIDKTHELSERTFNFCVYASYHFNNGNLQMKKEIFATIGSNLTLMDKNLSIEALHPYLFIEKELDSQIALYAGLEPTKRGYNKRKEAAFAASIPSWLRDLDSNQDTILQRDVSYH